MPSHNAVPPLIQYGTSAPSFNPNALNSSSLALILKILFITFNTAAASVLPPAMPAETGIFFIRFIETPSSIL